MKHAHVWFDGACSGNPGPMGAGAVIEMAGERTVLGLAMGEGKNNRAEYHGLILGLRHALAAGADEATVKGDSELVVRQLSGVYQVRDEVLQGLHAEALGLLRRFRHYTVEWIPRAANAEADAAARKAIMA